jgi:hypothetical protein
VGARGEREERVVRRLSRAARLADAASIAMRGLLRPLAVQGRFAPAPLPGSARRLVIVQLDGVSRTRLERAMADGDMPALAARLSHGGHAVSSCRSGAPASTPAFQAGLFYGVSPSVPGFVWLDRETGREVRMDRAADAAHVEGTLSRTGGAPLLRGGTAYFSIFSGGAALPHFCLSGLAGELELEWYEANLGPPDALASTIAHSVTAARSAVLLAHEIGAGIVDGVRWAAALGRLKHEPRFLVHRLLIGAVLRELAVQGILLDLSRGIPVVYVDFLGFDEYAHRRGPDSPAALRNLAAMDAALAMIFAAVDAAPELGYDVYVLSDHGHVATRPFEALVGCPLPEFVAMAERGEPLPRRTTPGTPNRGLLGGRSLGIGRTDTVATAEAGDLAHVYFLRESGPLPLDAIRARHWRVIAALSASHAVGVLAARGGRRGFALVRGAVLDLSDPQDVRRLPHPNPQLLAVYLSDLVSVPESGDLVVLGWRGAGRDVVAYAWEFGSHGGVAPEELETFVLHPASCRFPFESVVRPSELYRFFEAHYRAPAAEEEEALRAERAGGASGREAPPP